MLRMGYMPSDFHPVLLVLGEAAELTRVAAVLDEFARDGKSRALRADGLLFSTDTEVVLQRASETGRRGLSPSTPGSYVLDWRLLNHEAIDFAEEIRNLANGRAVAGSATLECGVIGEIKVTVSVGEWDDHFLSATGN